MTTFSVIRSAERDHWKDPAVISRQSFPATGSFDLEANAFGLLMVHNDDIVSPGEGFDMHFHKDVEIVSWIVGGAVRHRDSGSDTATVISTGMAQHISAGSGVRHSEVNDAGYTSRQTARIVQSWLPADTSGTTPSHKAHDFDNALSSGDFIQVAGPDSPLPLGTTGASMRVARLTDSVAKLPGAAFIHLYIISGNVTVAEHSLEEGDVLRAEDADSLTVKGSGEVLAWVMKRGI
ncbi:pirin family protein [uncultured Corynebacterium sp.]|uniref:pirin family protein n=1 Tax=uncultured Corynebacterium sp. TaxID=159447 RepID=UPI0025CF1099|nr:pirin family protein [uncultured Corynebacterium sp.]